MLWVCMFGSLEVVWDGAALFYGLPRPQGALFLRALGATGVSRERVSNMLRITLPNINAGIFVTSKRSLFDMSTCDLAE